MKERSTFQTNLSERINRVMGENPRSQRVSTGQRWWFETWLTGLMREADTQVCTVNVYDDEMGPV